MSCPLNFRDFPVDVNTCRLPIRSFAYPSVMLKYNWSEESPVNFDMEEIKLHQHKVTITWGAEEKSFADINFSYLYLELTFERMLTGQIIGIYIPSSLTVFTTWLPFWMGKNSTPDRVSLLVTSLLTLVTQFSRVRSLLPAVSYVNVSLALQKTKLITLSPRKLRFG